MDEIGDVLGALYIYHIFGPLHVKPSMYARNNIEENNTTTEMRLQSLNRSWTWYIEILSNMKTKAIVLVAKQKSYIYMPSMCSEEINISSFMEWLWSVPHLPSVGVQTQSPPLYLPRKLPQLGHEWVTCCMLSTQQGMQAQGQNPTKQRSPPTIQATTLGSDWVLVVTWAWQWGHVIVTGLYPKLGAATYWTWVTTWTGAWGCCGAGYEAGGGGAPSFPGKPGYICPGGGGGAKPPAPPAAMESS